MKSVKQVLVVLFIAIAFTATAGVEKATITTSAQCEMCKEAVEAKVSALEGVKKVMLNVDSKELKVKFDNEAVSLNDIKMAVSGLGYNADDMIADKTAKADLPKCCQPKSCCSSATKTSCTKGK